MLTDIFLNFLDHNVNSVHLALKLILIELNVSNVNQAMFHKLLDVHVNFAPTVTKLMRTILNVFNVLMGIFQSLEHNVRHVQQEKDLTMITHPVFHVNLGMFLKKEKNA